MDLDQMSYSYFQPLIWIMLVAAVIAIAGRTVKGRGNADTGEKLLDVSFAVTLVAGAYVVVLLLLTLFDEPDLIYDALVVLLVIIVFFAALVFLLYVVFELIGGRLGRRRPPRETAE